MWRFRTLANRYVNRLTLPLAKRLPGFAVLRHRGRTTGRTYRTPINVFQRGDDYFFFLTYGSDVNWVKNVLASGSCSIETCGRIVELAEPELITDPELRPAPPHVRVFERRVAGVTQYLHMHAPAAKRNDSGENDSHRFVLELAGVNVRRATDDDRGTLYALWDEWVERESSIPSWVEGAREGTRAGIDSAVRFGSAVIAEDGGEVLGFACGVMKGLRIGDLTELYVRPAARRRGIASELVRAVVAELRERGAAFVTGGVAPDNAQARSFYEKAGFRTVELRLVVDVDAVERRLAAGS